MLTGQHERLIIKNTRSPDTVQQAARPKTLGELGVYKSNQYYPGIVQIDMPKWSARLMEVDIPAHRKLS